MTLKTWAMFYHFDKKVRNFPKKNIIHLLKIRHRSMVLSHRYS